MKRSLLLLVGILAAATVSVVPVQALTPQEAQQKRQEIRQDMMENRQEIREEKKEMMQERKEDMVENMSQRHAKRLETRFMFYENRLMSLANKIERRLNLMEANGKDVAAAKAKLTEGRGKIAQASTLGDEAVAAFRALEAGDSTKESIDAAKAKAQQARQAFVAALQTLQESTQLAAKSQE